MTNFKMVSDVSDMRVHFMVGTLCSQNTSMPHCYQTELKSSTDSSLRLVTNILETRLSFTAPTVPDWLGGQNGALRIWNIQNPSLDALVPVFFRDDSIAEVVYVYPSSVKATGTGVVEVLVSRLGYLQDASKIGVFVAYDSSCETWSQDEGKGSAVADSARRELWQLRRRRRRRL